MTKNETITTWVIVAVVVLVVIGLGWWYFAQPSATPITTQSSEKLITSFTFSVLSPAVEGIIDNTNYAVGLTVPGNTNLTDLAPTILVSNFATVSPNSGSVEDFTSPVAYTVTAQDGSTQSYTVTVNSNSKKSITSFTFSELTPSVNGIIDNSKHTVSLMVPSGTDVTSLTPNIVIPENATISPLSGVAQDFTNPVTYKIIAQDGSTQNYKVTVQVSAVQ